jgi:hypothetical protein
MMSHEIIEIVLIPWVPLNIYASDAASLFTAVAQNQNANAVYQLKMDIGR